MLGREVKDTPWDAMPVPSSVTTRLNSSKGIKTVPSRYTDF